MMLVVEGGRCSGGPGRGRSQIADGIVKRSHQRPMMKRTTRRERRVEFMDFTMAIEDAWTSSAATYPIPIP